ncbi:hypothetical protein K1T71_012563 [Dendrolimus kikuchii]|uniref:Uncharacterized protein n=1 Tax=Dendrolimus kikuchii TaxID=765133 RepID=A0ACC1CJN5_9NEOP|nr:hypothetical protein K1T71_012563 [Dendrolimus kikuchii]
MSIYQRRIEECEACKWQIHSSLFKVNHVWIVLTAPARPVDCTQNVDPLHFAYVSTRMPDCFLDIQPLQILFPQTWWATAALEELKQEIADRMIQMAHFANIPYDEITDIRFGYRVSGYWST